jgi:CheY-like chemotaxis protein
MRILYVEDNPANLFLVQRVARMGSHEVLNYTNGESALENFDRDNPDLVLMDVQLSGAMTGLDVTRKLRSNGHKVPIIAVTAYAMVGDRERCLEAGCDDYLSKPLPVPKLLEIITKYDRKKAQTGALNPNVAGTNTPDALANTLISKIEPDNATTPPLTTADTTTATPPAATDATPITTSTPPAATDAVHTPVNTTDTTAAPTQTEATAAIPPVEAVSPPSIPANNGVATPPTGEPPKA